MRLSLRVLRISDTKPLGQSGEEGSCHKPCQPSYISVSGTGSLGMRLSSREVGKSAGRTFGLSPPPPPPTSSSKGLRGPPAEGSKSISDRESRGPREVVAGSSGMSDDEFGGAYLLLGSSIRSLLDGSLEALLVHPVQLEEKRVVDVLPWWTVKCCHCVGICGCRYLL